MSARQAFVPSGAPSRPESRSAHTGPAATDSPSAPLHFAVDPSNPLNGGPAGGNTTRKDRTENTDHLPLNIGSLTRGNRLQKPPPRRQSIQAPSRPSTSDPHSRPASSNHTMPLGSFDPHSNPQSTPIANHRVQARGIVAPTPLQNRSTPLMFSNSTQSSSFFSQFKTPALPGSRLSPPLSSDPFRAFANNGEQVQSTELSREDRSTETPYHLNTLPTQPEPHPIIGFGARAITDLTQDDDAPESDVAVRVGSKRGRSEFEDDEDEHERVHGDAKRFKAQQQMNENLYLRSSHQATETYHRSSTPSPHDLATQEYPPAQQPRQQQQQHHSAASRLGSTHPARAPPQYSTAKANNHFQADDGGAKRQLLHLLNAEDFDLAATADDKVAKYTRLSEKWKGCTKEEWLAGADDLAALYSKIFEFAKAHMASKLQRFSAIDDKVRDGQEVLKARDTLLVDVQGRLATDGENVLTKSM